MGPAAEQFFILSLSNESALVYREKKPFVARITPRQMVV